MIEEKRKFEVYQSPFQPENFQASVLRIIEQKAKDIIEKTNTKLQDIITKGYQEGFQKGYAAAIDKLDKEKDVYLKNAQKEFVDTLDQLKKSIDEMFCNYREFTRSICKLFVVKFLNKYVRQKIEINEQILFNAVDELFQYISTSATLKIMINKKYKSYADKWLENKKNEGYQIEVVFNDVDDSRAFIVGHNIYASVDFNAIIAQLTEKYFI